MPTTDASTTRSFLENLLLLGTQRRATAVYFIPDAPPSLRLDGQVVPVSAKRFTTSHVQLLIESLLDRVLAALFEKSKDLHTTVAIADGTRWRVNVFITEGQPAMVLRPISATIPSLESLALPKVLGATVLSGSGLVLVLSPSRTALENSVAALVEHRNIHGSGTISIADTAYPYEHIGKQCVIDKIGDERQPLSSQTTAPGNAIVWSPDAEISELNEALDQAVSTLCIVPRLVARQFEGLCGWLDAMVAELPEDSRHWYLTRLARTLSVATLIQPVPQEDGKGRVLAAEVLLNSPVVTDLLHQGRVVDLHQRMRSPGLREMGAQTLDAALCELYEAGQITYENALRYALDVNWLRLSIKLNSGRARAQDLSAGIEHLAIVGGGSRTLGTTPDPRRTEPAPSSSPSGFESREPLAELRDRVEFRAYTPETIAPNSSCVVDVWACSPSQAAEVARLAASTTRSLQAGLRKGMSITRGTLVTVRLNVEGLKVKGAAQSLLWDGEPGNLSFVVSAPADASLGPHATVARLLAGGIHIGELNFLLTVAVKEASVEPREAQVQQKLCRSAFASYATSDRAEMLARVQGMKTVAPDIDIFVDALSLRAGEDWKARVEAEVMARESLLLFWSPHARDSRWVHHEWQFALRRKGLRAIAPVPLADPRDAPPPRELRELHFNDAFLPYIEQERLRRERSLESDSIASSTRTGPSSRDLGVGSAESS